MANQNEQESHAGRTTLCCLAWNHTIHALFNHRAREYIDETTNTPRRYFDIDYTVNGEKTMNAILSLPAEAREKQTAELAEAAKIVTDDTGKREWVRNDTRANRIWLESCATSLTPVLYAYTGAILRATPAPPGQGKQGDSATETVVRQQRMGVIFDRLLMEFLPTMMTVKALDSIKIEGWKILHAMLDYSSADRLATWSMNRLLCEGFFRNDGHNKEIAGIYRDRACLDAAIEIASSGIQAKDIPAWGTEDICAKFVGGFGTLFVDALRGLSGIQRVEETGKWAGGTEALPLLPKYLSEIWESLLTHVSRQITGKWIDICPRYETDQPSIQKTVPPSISPKSRAFSSICTNRMLLPTLRCPSRRIQHTIQQCEDTKCVSTSLKLPTASCATTPFRRLA